MALERWRRIRRTPAWASYRVAPFRHPPRSRQPRAALVILFTHSRAREADTQRARGAGDVDNRRRLADLPTRRGFLFRQLTLAATDGARALARIRRTPAWASYRVAPFRHPPRSRQPRAALVILFTHSRAREADTQRARGAGDVDNRRRLADLPTRRGFLFRQLTLAATDGARAWRRIRRTPAWASYRVAPFRHPPRSRQPRAALVILFTHSRAREADTQRARGAGDVDNRRRLADLPTRRGFLFRQLTLAATDGARALAANPAHAGLGELPGRSVSPPAAIETAKGRVSHSLHPLARARGRYPASSRRR